MASKLLVAFSAVMLVAVLFMATFGGSLIAHPKFTVINASPLPVLLTVGWDGRGQPYSSLGPGQQIRFSVDAEAEMTLLARYPDGSTVASPSIYLSSGTLTSAKIFQTHIEFE